MKEKFLEFYRKFDKAVDGMDPIILFFVASTLGVTVGLLLAYVILFLYMNVLGPLTFLLIPAPALYAVYRHWPKE